MRAAADFEILHDDLIATEGELALAFSDVKLVSASAGAAPCP